MQNDVEVASEDLFQGILPVYRLIFNNDVFQVGKYLLYAFTDNDMIIRNKDSYHVRLLLVP
mgnify:CR=1 FL=1